MKLKAVIPKADKGRFWAEVPAPPGRVSQGETIQELNANLPAAIAGRWSVAAEQAASGAENRVSKVAL